MSLLQLYDRFRILVFVARHNIAINIRMQRNCLRRYLSCVLPAIDALNHTLIMSSRRVTKRTTTVRESPDPNNPGQTVRTTEVVDSYDDDVRPRSRGSIHQNTPTEHSFNRDLMPEDYLEDDDSPFRFHGAFDRSTARPTYETPTRGVISCHHPEPPIYLDYPSPEVLPGPGQFLPLAPAINRTPPYERGALKVTNAGSADYSRSSPRPIGGRLPTFGQSPPVWWNRDCLRPNNARPSGGRDLPINFTADPDDDVFAPVANQGQTQRLPLGGPPPSDAYGYPYARPTQATPSRFGDPGRRDLVGLFGHEGVDKRRLEQMGRLRPGTALPTTSQSPPERRRGIDLSQAPTLEETSPRRSPRERKTPRKLGERIASGIQKVVKRVTKSESRSGGNSRSRSGRKSS